MSEYAARLVVAHPTEQNAVPLVKQYIRYGASRGAQALILGGKLLRYWPDGIMLPLRIFKQSPPAALRHRLLYQRSHGRGHPTDMVIKELISSISQ
jgi:hypothetical protein